MRNIATKPAGNRHAENVAKVLQTLRDREVHFTRF